MQEHFYQSVLLMINRNLYTNEISKIFENNKLDFIIHDHLVEIGFSNKLILEYLICDDKHHLDFRKELLTGLFNPYPFKYFDSAISGVSYYNLLIDVENYKKRISIQIASMKLNKMSFDLIFKRNLEDTVCVNLDLVSLLNYKIDEDLKFDYMKFLNVLIFLHISRRNHEFKKI